MSYLICGVHRCGSTWYSSLLEATGVAGRPVVEHWNLGVEFRAHRARSFRTYRDYLAHVQEAASTPNGVVGVSILWRQMPGAMARMRTVGGWESLTHKGMWQRAIPGLEHFVFIYREDVLGQAISWARAFQTQKWTCRDQGNGRQPEYDFALIDSFYWDVWAHNFAWASWFARFGITPLKVKYEDVVADPAGTVKQTLDFLGLELPADYVCPAGFSKQSDRLNDEWRERAEAEFAARHIQLEHYQPA